MHYPPMVTYSRKCRRINDDQRLQTQESNQSDTEEQNTKNEDDISESNQSDTEEHNTKNEDDISESSDSNFEVSTIDPNRKKNMKIEGFQLPEQYNFKQRPLDEFNPTYYRRNLNAMMLVEDSNVRNKFHEGNEGRVMKWPHPFKDDQWMVSIEPKTINVDLDVDLKNKTTKTHAVVCSNNARKMIFHPWVYDDHHNSQKFISEYNQYVIGMIYKYRTLVEAILQYPKEDKAVLPHEATNQFAFVIQRLDAVAGAVSDFQKGPIGKYNTQFVRSTVNWIESVEDAEFVSAMANCERYEIQSKYTHPRKSDESGYWVFYTNVYYPQINGSVEHNTFAFGWNRTNYDLRINVDRCLNYRNYFMLFRNDFQRRQSAKIGKEDERVNLLCFGSSIITH